MSDPSQPNGQPQPVRVPLESEVVIFQFSGGLEVPVDVVEAYYDFEDMKLRAEQQKKDHRDLLRDVIAWVEERTQLKLTLGMAHSLRDEVYIYFFAWNQRRDERIAATLPRASSTASPASD